MAGFASVHYASTAAKFNEKSGESQHAGLRMRTCRHELFRTKENAMAFFSTFMCYL